MSEQGHGFDGISEKLVEDVRKQVEAATTMDSFDLSEWVQKKATRITFSETVFLDVERGARRSEIVKRLQEIDREVRQAEARAKQERETMTLGIGEEVPAENMVKALTVEKKNLSLEKDDLESEIVGSSLTFHMHSLEQREADAIRKEVEERLGFTPAKLKALSKEEQEQLQGELSEELICNVFIACVDRITNGRGQEHSGEFTRENLEGLRHKLIPMEWVKLINASSRAMMVGNVFDKMADAGFPGGDADVAG